MTTEYSRIVGRLNRVLGFVGFCTFSLVNLQAQETDGSAATRAIIFGDSQGRRSSTQFPSNPVDYYMQLREARALKKAGSCSDAVFLYEQLTSEYRDDSAVWYDYGNCLAELDRREEAIEALQEAVTLGTTYWGTNPSEHVKEVFLKIGLLYAEEDNNEMAVKWVKKAVDENYWQLPYREYFPEIAALLDSYSVNLPIGRQPTGVFTRTEKWLHDIAYLEELVSKHHYDPSLKTPESVREQMLRELSNNISELTDRQIVARLFRYIGMLGTGHDMLYAGTGLQWFSLKTYMFADGLYIIEADDEKLVGTRIEKFNDTDASSAFELISSSMSTDNTMWPLLLGMRYIMSPDLLEEFGVVDNSENVILTLTDQQGNTKEVVPQLRPYIAGGLLALGGDENPLYLSRLDEAFWFTELAESRALYLQVNTMNEASPGGFSNISEKIQAAAENPSVEHLILDVRHNSGGSESLSVPIVRALTHFDASPDKGDIYILIGRNTFSAAQILIGSIEKFTDAIFVGEPSGSSPIFPGPIFQFQLPFSGAIGSVATSSFQTTGPGDSRIWVAPDIPVTLTSQQYFAGEDPALNIIKGIISLD